MTPQDHNKIIGILFIISGSLTIFSLASAILQISLDYQNIQKVISQLSKQNPAFPVYFNLIVTLLVALLALSLIGALFNIAAGIGMVKRKSWARILGVVAAILSLPGIPVGTALGVYALWFLFGEKGKQFYDVKESTTGFAR